MNVHFNLFLFLHILFAFEDTYPKYEIKTVKR